jgi:hypothetical protein
LSKQREGIISNAKGAVVETAKAGLDVAVAGIEVTKDAAVSAGTAVEGGRLVIGDESPESNPQKAFHKEGNGCVPRAQESWFKNSCKT